jgi:hypothetical protein
MSNLETQRRTRQDIEAFSRPCKRGEQRQVGVTYWNAYWGFLYEVVAISGCQVTCRMPDGFVWTHMTPLDTRRDRVMDAEILH